MPFCSLASEPRRWSQSPRAVSGPSQDAHFLCHLTLCASPADWAGFPCLCFPSISTGAASRHDGWSLAFLKNTFLMHLLPAVPPQAAQASPTHAGPPSLDQHRQHSDSCPHMSLPDSLPWALASHPSTEPRAGRPPPSVCHTEKALPVLTSPLRTGTSLSNGTQHSTPQPPRTPLKKCLQAKFPEGNLRRRPLSHSSLGMLGSCVRACRIHGKGCEVTPQTPPLQDISSQFP